MNRASGIINISTLSSLMQKWLTPRLHRLHAKYPELRVDWHTAREAVDFARSDFHAAVRLGEAATPGLDYDKLMDEWLVVVASPKLFKKFGSLDDRESFEGIPMLQARDEPWAKFEKSAAPTPWPAGPTIIDDSVSVISAVIEGLGYAPARWSIAANDLDNGNLVLASKTIVPSRFSYWFVCPPSYSEMPMVLALRQWHARVQHDVGAHHAADRARGADHRNAGVRLREDLERRGRNSAEKIEGHEAHVAHRVLDVVPEDPQEPHVADQVEPAAVHEHRGDHGVPGAAVAAQRADRIRRQRKARPCGCGVQQIGRHQPKLADRRRQRRLRTETLDQRPDEGVDRDQAVGGVRRREVRIVIPDREHAPIVMKCRATGSQSLCRALEGRKAATRLTGNDCEPVARHSVGRLTTRAAKP